MPTKNSQELKYDIYNLKGEKVLGAKINDPVNDVDKYAQLLAQVVRVYLINQRQGNASTKTRGEVRGSTRKIYKQKGTGRARHGDIKAPIFVGGGIIFGPKTRDFSRKLTKKMKQKAFLISIIDKLKNQKLIVIKELEKTTAKTKDFANLLKAIFSKSTVPDNLLVINQGSKNLILAVRNIPNTSGVSVNIVNTYDILSHDYIILSDDALAKLFDRLGIEKNLSKRKTIKTKKT